MRSARSLRHAFMLLVASALLVAPPAGRAGDDTTLFGANVPPNVMLFIDESGSMRNIIQHGYFDGGAAPFVMSDSSTCDALPLAQGGTNTYADESSPAKTINVVTGGSTGHRFEPWRTELSDWTATPNATDDPNQGYVERRYCGQDRKLYTDPFLDTFTRTLWPRLYLNWYFHLESSVVYNHPDPANPETKTGAEILAEIEAANSGRDYISGLSQPEYQVARITAAKRVAKEVMYRTNSDCPAFAGDCGVYEDRVRFGIAEFRGNDGAYVSHAPTVYDASGKASLEATVNALTTGGQTPLGETLFQLYTYFMKRGTAGADAADRPAGEDSTRMPAYQYELDGSYSTLATDWAADPIAFDCQKQFVIMITDGAPTQDQFTANGNVTQGFADFHDMIGDFAPDLATEDDWDQAAATWSKVAPQKEEGSAVWPQSHSAGYLDDIALFMQDRDLRGDIADKQVVDVYTLGFTTIGPVNTLLSKTARNGNGKFFRASVGGELADALSNALQDVIAKSQSFTAATVPASRATDGNNFYASYFQPSQSAPFWEGHLKAFEFNKLGEVRDKPVPPATAGACALDDPLAPLRCKAGRLKVELDGYWDAADEIPVPASRNLYVSLNQGTRPTSIPSSMTDFDTSLTTGDLNFTGLGLSIANLGDFSVAGSTASIATDDELKDAIVRYITGCEFGSGSCVDRGDRRKLFDIFHSNPMAVGPPNAGINESSYREFVTRYKHRKRVLYAGSNGGFLHAFNTGEYDTAAVPGAYDRGTGAEEFGFMAWPARQDIANLPRTTTPKRYYMDGSPVAADVWLYRSPSAGSLLPEVNPEDITAADDWNYWRTVLLGGMRQGGRSLWALDVTNPPDHNSSGGEQSTGPAFPGYMWEFPCESTDAECLGTGAVPTGRILSEYMGETWSEPVITRVKVRVNCSTGCTHYDRWVAIFGAGYDPEGDPNKSHNASATAGVRATDTAADDYDASFDAGTSRKGRAVFMVDITTGELLAMRRFDHNTLDGDPAMRFAFTGAPAVFDLNFDGYGDVVYFGDLGGNLWKWVISSTIEDPINSSGSDVEHRWDGTSGWKFLKVMSAASCGPIEGCVAARHYRSFFAPPQGAMVGSRLWLTLGSGERTELDYIGTLAAQKNRFYTFHDDDPLEREVALPAAGVPRFSDAGASTDFVDASTLSGSCTPPASPAVGFYFEGEHGEKFITETEIFFGVVLTGSFVADASATTCNSGGEARLYGFKLLCGEGIFPDPGGGGGTVEKISIGSGLPARPRVSVGPVDGGGGGGGPCTDMVVVITSEGEAFSGCPGGRPDSGVNLRSWRDDR